MSEIARIESTKTCNAICDNETDLVPGPRDSSHILKTSDIPLSVAQLSTPGRTSISLDVSTHDSSLPYPTQVTDEGEDYYPYKHNGESDLLELKERIVDLKLLASSLDEVASPRGDILPDSSRRVQILQKQVERLTSELQDANSNIDALKQEMQQMKQVHEFTRSCWEKEMQLQLRRNEKELLEKMDRKIQSHNVRVTSPLKVTINVSTDQTVGRSRDEQGPEVSIAHNETVPNLHGVPKETNRLVHSDSAVFSDMTSLSSPSLISSPGISKNSASDDEDKTLLHMA
ncbi:uncharacterized protein LOC102801626 [Saccoglossus kowalevskii]